MDHNPNRLLPSPEPSPTPPHRSADEVRQHWLALIDLLAAEVARSLQQQRQSSHEAGRVTYARRAGRRRRG